ncbi:unnamed protein product [Caenorhabditis auriculariae]|uniref:Uncharacterized protein n=1 Tax=Caenorhabditis auriculariae TaxID=2777116 RepID=A0A8S1HK36_9PELO|nr:unnamed protein product [Caenorhabditis auriculariae]
MSLLLSGWPENSESRQRMLESASSSNFTQHFVSREVPLAEKLKTLARRCKNGIILFLVPLIFAPLLFSDRKEAKCGYCVCVIAIYWMCEVMPLAVTAMMPVVLFPLCGVLDTHRTSQEYMNDTNFLFIGGLIMAAAVEKCELHERIALFVLRHVGSEPKWIMLGFMTVTALLSSFISNTATTAMMVPIGQSVIQQLITSFQNHPQSSETHRGRMGCKRMATGLVLSICFAANIGGTGTLTGTPSNLVLVGQAAMLYADGDSGIAYTNWMFFAYPLMLICLFICWITLVFFFLKDAPAKDEHVTAMLKDRYARLPRMSYAEKSVLCCFALLLSLWIFRNPGMFEGFGVLFSKGFYSDSTSAMIVSFLLFILPAEKPDLQTYLKSDELRNKKCLMDWDAMKSSFPWNVVLLLGGGFALAAGVKESGLSDLIGHQLTAIEHLPIWALQLLIMVIAMAITNICSNTVTASIFLPIVATLAQQAGHHPLTLMMPVTLAASFAFILPVGTPPNAIVFGSGLVKVTDMVVVGLIVSMEMLFTTIIYINMFGQQLLPMDKIPNQNLTITTTLRPCCFCVATMDDRSTSTCDDFENRIFHEVDSATVDVEDWNATNLNAAIGMLDKLNLSSQPSDVQVGGLRRRSELLYGLSNYEENRTKRIEHLENARKAAEEGNQIEPNNFEILKLLCSTTGRLAEESGLTKKVQYGFMFKTYLDKALAVDSNNFELLHMRGRFCYQVANLSMIERMAAKVIGQVPNVSFQDALDDLLKAETICDGVAENQLYIGKAYLAMDKIKEARKWLETAAAAEYDDAEAVEKEHVDEAKQILETKPFR